VNSRWLPVSYCGTFAAKVMLPKSNKLKIASVCYYTFNRVTFHSYSRFKLLGVIATGFVQAGCPLVGCPTNSIKALQEKSTDS